MEWSRFKTIILCILLLTNLCLGALTLYQAIQRRGAEVQSLDHTLSFLQSRGIQVSRELIPRQTHPPQLVNRDVAREAKSAAALLEEPLQSQSVGSEIFRYSNQHGFLQYHANGFFYGVFPRGIFPQGSSVLTQAALHTIEDMGLQGDVLWVESPANQPGTTFVTLRQRWQGNPIFNHRMTLRYEDNSLVAIEDGRWMLGEATPDTTTSSISPQTALMRFYQSLTAMGDVCSRIDTITIGHMATSSLPNSGAIQLRPVWHIVTDTGEYLLDLITGGLTRVRLMEQEGEVPSFSSRQVPSFLLSHSS